MSFGAGVSKGSSVVAVGVALLIGAMPGVTVAHLLLDVDVARDPFPVVRTALASMLLIGFAYGLRLRRARGRGGALHRLNTRLFPLALSPMLLLFPDAELASTRGGLVVAAAVVLGLAVVRSRLAGSRPRPRAPWRWEWVTVVVASLTVGGYLGHLALVRHAAMQTNTYDFGLFANAIWNTSQGRWFACTLVPSGSILDEHVSPALLWFAWLFRLGLPATSLLVVQALFLASGAVPAYFIARRHLGAAGGRVFAFAFLIHPSLHANALWDFHPLSFAAPLLLWLVLLGRAPRIGIGFVASLVALLMLREELAFVVLAYSATLALRGRPLRGVGLAAAGGLALWAVNVATGHTSSHLSRYAEVAERGGGGLSGVVRTVGLDPGYVLSHALTYPKVVYLAMQMGGVFALALLARGAWPLLGFAVAFPMLATSAHVSNPYFHYTTMVYPIVFALAPAGVTWASLRWRGTAPIATARRAWLSGVLVASAALSFAYGGLHDNPSFRAGFVAPRRDVGPKATERLRWLRARLEEISPEASLAVSGRIGPHVIGREAVYAYPTERDVDLLVLFRSDLRPAQKRLLQQGVESGQWRVREATGSILIYERIR